MKLYGVSVGCGDYELMTLKAVKILEKSSVIAVPKTHKDNTMALDIIKNVIDISKKEIIYLDFKMSRNVKENNLAHIKNAEKIINYLKNSDVAVISIGDISVFSTFSYILDIVKSKGYDVEVIPGVPSFCAVAAKLQQSLTSMKKPLHIIPASFSNIEEVLKYDGNKVIMKSGSKLNEVLDKLEDRNYSIVQNCGLENEVVYKKGEDRDKLSDSYFTTILVKED
ncbi:MAG: precorrin-2 C(20)-methyltransferase [Lachnospirales bacterium]